MAASWATNPGRAHAGATSASDAPDDPDAGLDRLSELVGGLLAQVNLAAGAVQAELHGFLSLGAANIVGQDDLRVLRHHRLDLAGKGFTHRLGPGGLPLRYATLDGAAVTAGRRP
jgi:hypothetical protein